MQFCKQRNRFRRWFYNSGSSKIDVDNNIDEHEEIPADYHGENQNAGSQYGNHKTKEGASPKSIVVNAACFIDSKIKNGELFKDKIFVFVDYDDKNYVFTLKYVLGFCPKKLSLNGV